MLESNLYAIFKDKINDETYFTITPVIGWVKDEDAYVSLVIYPPVDTNIPYHNLALPCNSKIISESFGKLQKYVTKDDVKKESLSLKEWCDKDSDNRFITCFMV